MDLFSTEIPVFSRVQSGMDASLFLGDDNSNFKLNTSDQYEFVKDQQFNLEDPHFSKFESAGENPNLSTGFGTSDSHNNGFYEEAGEPVFSSEDLSQQMEEMKEKGCDFYDLTSDATETKRHADYELELECEEAELYKQMKVSETKSKKSANTPGAKKGKKDIMDEEFPSETSAESGSSSKRSGMSKNYKGVVTTGFAKSLEKSLEVRECLHSFVRNYRNSNSAFENIPENVLYQETLQYAELNIRGKAVTKSKNGGKVDSYRVGNTKQIKEVFYPENASPMTSAVASILKDFLIKGFIGTRLFDSWLEASREIDDEGRLFLNTFRGEIQKVFSDPSYKAKFKTNKAISYATYF